MVTVGGSVAGSDALRAYISTLRSVQGYSQDAVADSIGIARRTYIAWETGETKDIKAPLIIRAIKLLGGAFGHLADLDEATEEEAERKAREWLKMTPEERAQVERIHAKFRRVIEIGDQDPERLEQVVEQIRADARADPAILDLVLAYMAGRRSSLPG